MRLAVISDIHGNLMGLEAVLADLKQQGDVDAIWVLGDLCAFGSRPVECIDLVRSLKNVQIISGNTDRYLVTGTRPKHRVENEEMWASYAQIIRGREMNFSWTLSVLTYKHYEFLANLRGETDLHVPEYGWVIGYHGSPGNDEYVMLPDTPAEEVLDQLSDRDGRLGFGGHTHMAMDRDLGAWRVINVGSVGMPADDIRSPYALVTFENDSATVDLRRVSYDVDAAIADLRDRNPNWEWVAGRLRAPLQSG
jgi:predicted phosphodiesterase